MGEVAPGGETGDPERLGEQGRRREREEAAGLWPIRRALTVAGMTAVAGLVLLMAVVLAVLGFPHLQHTSTLPLAQLLDVLKFVLGTVAGVGALFALVTAYRRQRLAEAAHDYAQRVDAIQQAHQERLARNAEHDAEERRITELYNAAAEQLASDKAPVRLTALYTLERLANDNPRHRQTIVNIICAYLRMPYTPPPPGPEEEHRERARRNAARFRAARDLRPAPTEPGTGGPDPQEERQVRLTAQRLLSTHLQPNAEPHWADISLDLTGAALTDFNLAGCTVNHAAFSRATFSGDADFAGATFSGDTDFAGATFGFGGFNEAIFSDDADFGKTTFSKGAVFHRAIFSGYADFAGATFGFGGFHETIFSDEADFGKTTFSDEADFDMTTFSGNARFLEAAFSFNARFAAANFSGGANFDKAAFSWDAVFNAATFCGNARFDAATFSGNATFHATRFEAGVEIASATVTEAAGYHVPPPGWRIEPTEGAAGRFGRTPAPANGS